MAKNFIPIWTWPSQLSQQTLVVTIDPRCCIPETLMENLVMHKNTPQTVQGLSYKRLRKFVSKNIGVISKFPIPKSSGDHSKYIVMLFISVRVTTFEYRKIWTSTRNEWKQTFQEELKYGRMPAIPLCYIDVLARCLLDYYIALTRIHVP